MISKCDNLTAVVMDISRSCLAFLSLSVEQCDPVCIVFIVRGINPSTGPVFNRLIRGAREIRTCQACKTQCEAVGLHTVVSGPGTQGAEMDREVQKSS